MADDHRAFRESVARLLDAQPDMAVADQAADGGEALRKIRADGFGLVLLDISMPVKSGFDVLRVIAEDYPGLPVIMLSMYPPELYKERARALGASGYIAKDAVADELIGEIRRVMSESTGTRH